MKTTKVVLFLFLFFLTPGYSFWNIVGKTNFPSESAFYTSLELSDSVCNLTYLQLQKWKPNYLFILVGFFIVILRNNKSNAELYLNKQLLSFERRKRY